jgi:Transposase zinc-binding domain
MTTLRRRMLEDLQLRGLATQTQQCSLAAAQQLAPHYRRAPDQLRDDILRRYGTDDQERVGAHRLPRHRRAMEAILRCRTEAFGGQLLPGAPWGPEHDVSHPCRHRRCPTCHRHDTAAWLEERRQALLPVPYFHVVCTVPQA